MLTPEQEAHAYDSTTEAAETLESAILSAIAASLGSMSATTPEEQQKGLERLTAALSDIRKRYFQNVYSAALEDFEKQLSTDYQSEVDYLND